MERHGDQSEIRDAVHLEYGRLLHDLQRGDLRAAEQFYETFLDDVKKMIWRILGPDPEHDDLINDVFLRALSRCHQVHDASKLRSWLLQLTVNVVRNALSKRGVQRRYFDRSDSHEEFGGRVPDPEARRLLQRCLGIMEQLPAELRVVFTLRFAKGESLEETASLCGCSTGTIKRRQKRAEHLFLKLAGEDPELLERLAESPRWGTA